MIGSHLNIVNLGKTLPALKETENATKKIGWKTPPKEKKRKEVSLGTSTTVSERDPGEGETTE